MSDSPETKDVPSYHAGVGRAPIAWQAVTGSCSGFLANRFEAGFAKFRLGSLCSVRLGGKPRLGACRRCPGGGRLRASAEAEEPQRASQGRWGTFDDVRCATCAALIIIIIILLCPPPGACPLVSVICMKEVGVSVGPPMAAEAWSMVETTWVSSVTCGEIFSLGLHCDLADKTLF